MKDEPVVRITDGLKGFLTVSDILTSEGTFVFVLDITAIFSDQILIQLDAPGFQFRLSCQRKSLVFQRNGTVLVYEFGEGPPFEDSDKVSFCLMWSHSEISIEGHVLTGKEKDAKSVLKVATQPTAPSEALLKWARQENLIERKTFKSEEEFREKVHACLLTVNQKIRQASAYKSFWNIEYEGNKIIERRPKREVDIQPLIHCLLSDQMFLNNIEIVPEYPTGAGDLDFLFLGFVEGEGFCKFCAEFKLAHSADLNHGLWAQLPDYMQVSNALYGAYCVLNFKGEWFDEPNVKEDSGIEITLGLIPAEKRLPVHDNIRCMFFNLSKGKTASIK